MIKLTLHKKSGFRNLGRGRTVIFDGRGRVFYSHFVKGTFNLPKGVYLLPEGLNIVAAPVRTFGAPKLPRKERNNKLPKKVDIVKMSVPEKARIYVHRHKIEIDNNFFDGLDKPTRTFILLHEIGHYLYTTEWKADLYAARRMLKMGFNPSQIGKAINETLSITNETNDRRKRIILHNYFTNGS